MKGLPYEERQWIVAGGEAGSRDVVGHGAAGQLPPTRRGNHEAAGMSAHHIPGHAAAPLDMERSLPNSYDSVSGIVSTQERVDPSSYLVTLAKGSS